MIPNMVLSALINLVRLLIGETIIPGSSASLVCVFSRKRLSLPPISSVLNTTGWPIFSPCLRITMSQSRHLVDSIKEYSSQLSIWCLGPLHGYLLIGLGLVGSGSEYRRCTKLCERKINDTHNSKP